MHRIASLYRRSIGSFILVDATAGEDDEALRDSDQPLEGRSDEAVDVVEWAEALVRLAGSLRASAEEAQQ